MFLFSTSAPNPIRAPSENGSDRPPRGPSMGEDTVALELGTIYT